MSSDTPTRVRVRVPATSANLGPGFDAFGLALTLYDEIVVEPGEPEPSRVGAGDAGHAGRRVLIDVTGEGAEAVPRDERHLIVRAIDATYGRLGFPLPGMLRLECRNRIPHARGLGSSAAAIVAGVLAARALIPEGERRLPDPEALRLAARLEGHPDNVAACLFGGLTIAWGGEHAAAVRLEPADLDLVAFVPERSLSTEAARGVLPERVPHADAAANAGRAGLLVGALTGALTEVAGPAWLEATDDLLHQPYRSSVMPESSRLVGRLRALGVPAVISGAGPTVLAFGKVNDLVADDPDAPRGFRSFPLGIDRAGTTVQADLR